VNDKKKFNLLFTRVVLALSYRGNKYVLGVTKKARIYIVRARVDQSEGKGSDNVHQ
jgi:hypothetical protein